MRVAPKEEGKTGKRGEEERKKEEWKKEEKKEG